MSKGAFYVEANECTPELTDAVPERFSGTNSLYDSWTLLIQKVSESTKTCVRNAFPSKRYIENIEYLPYMGKQY